MPPVEPLIQIVAACVRERRLARQLFASRLAPDFNPFFINWPGELALSRILCELLNPHGRHGQGTRFLEAFLRIAIPDWVDLGFCSSNVLLEACVALEVRTSKDRKIDVVVDFPNRRARLMIENKPYAADQEDQVIDYIRDAEHGRFARFVLLYVSPFGADPGELSIGQGDRVSRNQAGQLRCISYVDHIVKWLDACWSHCEADVVRTFLANLKQFVLAQYDGTTEMDERKSIAEVCLKSDENLSAALEIANAEAAIDAQLAGMLRAHLERLVAERGWSMRWPRDFFADRDGIRILFSNSPQLFAVAFEFNWRQQDFYWSIKSESPQAETNTDLVLALSNIAGGKVGDDKEKWPSWRNIERYRAWKSPAMRVDARNGKLAAEIMTTAEMLFDALREQNVLGRLVSG